MAERLGTSRRSVQTIIKEDFKKNASKTKVHVLAESHKANRQRNAGNFTRSISLAISGSTWSRWTKPGYTCLHAMAEARFATSEKERVPDEFVYEKDGYANNNKKFMTVAAISGRGVLGLIQVPIKVEISSTFYVEEIGRASCRERV